MDEQPDPTTEYDHLRRLATLHEVPFTSDVPVVGGLIVWFRNAWNSVATKWYIRPLAAQQTTFNETVIEKLAADRQSIRDDLAQVLAQTEQTSSILDERLVAQDREQVQAVHDLGELAAQLTALRGAVSELEARLARLESDTG